MNIQRTGFTPDPYKLHFAIGCGTPLVPDKIGDDQGPNPDDVAAASQRFLSALSGDGLVDHLHPFSDETPWKDAIRSAELIPHYNRIVRQTAEEQSPGMGGRLTAQDVVDGLKQQVRFEEAYNKKTKNRELRRIVGATVGIGLGIAGLTGLLAAVTPTPGPVGALGALALGASLVHGIFSYRELSKIPLSDWSIMQGHVENAQAWADFVASTSEP